MFNNTKINQLSSLLNIRDKEFLETILKRQASYLKINSTLLLKSYSAVVHEIKKEYDENKIKVDKYTSKNLIINKYKNTIVDLYQIENYGYLKISKYLELHHRTKVSKSSIEHFIKSNGITKNGKS